MPIVSYQNVIWIINSIHVLNLIESTGTEEIKWKKNVKRFGSFKCEEDGGGGRKSEAKLKELNSFLIRFVKDMKREEQTSNKLYTDGIEFWF